MNAFSSHNQTVPLSGILSRTTTPLLRVETDRANIDQRTDGILRQEELRLANQGVDHSLSPEDVDDYAIVLQRAQRKLGVREIVIDPGQEF